MSNDREEARKSLYAAANAGAKMASNAIDELVAQVRQGASARADPDALAAIGHLLNGAANAYRAAQSGDVADALTKNFDELAKRFVGGMPGVN